MKKNSLFLTTIAIVFIAIPFFYLALIWSELPKNTVEINGKIDFSESKKQFLASAIFFAIFSIGAYFSMDMRKRINPAFSTKMSDDIFNKLRFTYIIFSSAFSIYILHSGISNGMDNFYFVLFGLLITALGNLMHSLKPNYLVGVRFPWTLNNEDIWRKTHQLASKMWFVAGLLIAFSASLFPEDTMFSLMNIGLVIIVFLPIIYSYGLFKKAF